MTKIIVLSESDLNELRSYEHLIREASEASHLALDKIIVLKQMISYGGENDKEIIISLIQAALDLTRVARDQNNMLIKYLNDVDE